MSKVFVISSSPESVVSGLDRCKFEEIRSFREIGDLNGVSSSPDLIVLKGDEFGSDSVTPLRKSYPTVPIIVLTDKKRPRLSRKKHLLTQVLASPGCAEIKRTADFLESIRRILLENRSLSQRMSSLQFLVEVYEEINHLITITDDLAEIFTSVMKKVRSILNSDGFLVMLKDPELDALTVSVTSQRRRRAFRNVRLSFGERIAGWVAQKGRSVTVDDVKKDKRFKSEAFLHKDFGTHSLIALPIAGKDSLLGVLEVINREGSRYFTEDDLLFLSRIVKPLSVAIEKIILQQKMAELAITDDLTKLFNTRYLQRTLEIEIERCNRYGTSLSLIFMDLDFFKNVNDKYGHLIGSKVLVELGQLLLGRLRSVDIVARYGGDEFVIVLPQTSSHYAKQIAERLRRTISGSVFLKEEGLNIRVTASFGVASYPDRAKSKEDLLKLADEAMYKVKYRTRNGVYAII